MGVALAVFIGGGIGSLARYGVGRIAAGYWNGAFPMGTFLANVLACAVLAISLYVFRERLQEYSWLSPMILIGFCGGFSTFSTFSLETMQLFQSGQTGTAILYIASSLVLCTGMIWWISRLVSPQ